MKVHITSIFSMTTNMCPTVVLKAYNYICIFYFEFTYIMYSVVKVAFKFNSSLLVEKNWDTVLQYFSLCTAD